MNERDMPRDEARRDDEDALGAHGEDALRALFGRMVDDVHDPDPLARAQQVISDARGGERRRRGAVAVAGAVALALAAGGTALVLDGRDDAGPSPDWRATPAPVTSLPAVVPSTSASTSARATASSSAPATPTGQASATGSTAASTAASGTARPSGSASEAATGRPAAPVQPTTTATAPAGLPAGAAVAAVPRSELVAGRWMLVTAAGRVALPSGAGLVTTVVGSGDSRLVIAHDAGYTGGDTDPAARLLRVSGATATTLATGEFGGLVPSPDGSRAALLLFWRGSVELQVLGTTGEVVRTIPVSLPGVRDVASLDVSVEAWTTEGIVVSATSFDAASTTAPVRRLVTPEGQWSAMPSGVESVVPLGPGRVVLLRPRQGGHQCFVVATSVRDDGAGQCATGQLTVRGAGPGGAVSVTAIDAATGAVAKGLPVWLVDPDGTVHQALAPRPGLVDGPALWESPGVAVHQSVDDAGRATWVRWRLADGHLERAGEPSGQGTVQG